MKTTKTITKIVACLSALALILVCFASCAKTVKAEEMKVSATEITVKKGEKAYFAIAVNFEDSDANKTVSEGIQLEIDDENAAIAKVTELAASLSEESTHVHVSTEKDAADEVVSNVAVADNLYIIPADNVTFTADDLGEDVVKFVTTNAQAGHVAVYEVEGVAAGTVTLTFTAGDQTATVKVTVAE